MGDSLAADTVALIARSHDVTVMLPNGIAWPLGVMTLLGAYLVTSEAVEIVRGIYGRITRKK